MQLNRTFAILCAFLLFSDRANAQSTSFDTYSDALSFLLGVGDADCGFAPPGPGGITNPDLTILDPNDGGVPPKTGLIGPNLSRHCSPNTNNSNLSGGSAVGGSFSSLQSTRTVSQFDVSRRPAEQCDPSEDPNCEESESEPISNYFYQGGLFPTTQVFSSVLGGREGVLNASTLIPLDGFSIFGEVQYDNYRQSSTRYEPSRKLDIFTGQFGAIWDVSDDALVGFKGEYSTGNGKSPATNSLIIPNLGPGNADALAGDFNEVCGISSGGRLDQDEFSGSVFYQTRFRGAGFFSAEVGASKTKLKYQQSLCVANIGSPDGINLEFQDVTAGIISGSPESYGLFANLWTGYDWDHNGTAFGPRLSLNTSWQTVDGYSESEQAGSLHPITGAGLRYDDQDLSSVQTRIGFAVSRPVTLNSMTIVPFAQLDYVHEFANDQRAIRATFVEDGRPDPFDFTFKTNSPDRDFFELRGGVVAEIFNGGVAYIDGRAILANDLVDNYGVTGGLRVSF